MFEYENLTKNHAQKEFGIEILVLTFVEGDMLSRMKKKQRSVA